MFESTIEETDINSSIETIDKIAGGRAVHDNTADAIVADRGKIAEEVAEFLAEQPIEDTLDNTVDPSNGPWIESAKKLMRLSSLIQVLRL